VADTGGRPQLWVRSLDSVAARALPGTDFATFPFWSPDSRAIGFFAEGRLKRIELAGGAPQEIGRVSNPRGAAWLDEATILFAENGPILRVPATGGEPRPVTRIGPNQQAHRFPQVLPGGRRFLYYAMGNAAGRGLYVGSIDAFDSTRLVDSETVAVYAPSGHLLFVRQGTLVAQAFDIATPALSGDPFPVAEEVSRDPSSIQIAAVSVSPAGPIAYRAGPIGVRRRLVWFDRSGAVLGTVGDPSAGQNPSLSPDDLRVAVDQTVAGNVDIWMTDVRRDVTDRLTSDESIDAYPTWSGDGGFIAFGSIRTGLMDLFWRRASGADGETLLLATPETKAPTDWSRDGRFLVYRSVSDKTGYDLWALPIGAGRVPGRPFIVAQTAFDERDGVLSPNGRWVAYEANESGRSEIYLQRFPDPEGNVRVSAVGGAQARWSRDGRELFYLSLDGVLMAVPVRPEAAQQADAIAGPPVALFPARVGPALQGAARQRYMVSADGRRFLMNTVADEAQRPITIMLNWRPERPAEK
jgi:Tol biopolymer transport system component